MWFTKMMGYLSFVLPFHLSNMDDCMKSLWGHASINIGLQVTRTHKHSYRVMVAQGTVPTIHVRIKAALILFYDKYSLSVFYQNSEE